MNNKIKVIKMILASPESYLKVEPYMFSGEIYEYVGMCEAIRQSGKEIGLVRYEIEELDLFAPHKTGLPYFWFKLNKKGFRARISILKKLLKHLEQCEAKEK